MFDNEINDTIESGNLLLLRSNSNELFLYDYSFNMLIPIQQEEIKKEYGYFTTISPQKCRLNDVPLKKVLIKEKHAKTIFHKLSRIPKMQEWKIEMRKWFIDEDYEYDSQTCTSIYDGKSERTGVLRRQQKAHILRVIYLPGNRILNDSKVNLYEITKCGLFVDEKTTAYRMGENSSNNPKFEQMDDSIQNLLDCDKKRCGLASYEKEMLYDIKAGHWDVFESKSTDSLMGDDDKLIARDPRLDIKKNGVIGIDFGTKSTVVVKQEGSNEIRPIRIGSLSLKAEVAERDFENPTIISCMNISKFLKDYDSKKGRPETSCEDLFVSYNAYNDYKNCSTENFYAYYSDLKQWANSEKSNAVVLDTKAREKYNLDEDCSLEKHTLNPIEVYAYYIGMYINNMRNRRGYFDCKLAPIMEGEDGQTTTSYHVWKKFQGAGVGIARIYYTEDPRADSKNEKLDINNIPFHEVTFKPEEDKYLYIRAIKPSVIEYAVAFSDEQIGDAVEILNIDER